MTSPTKALLWFALVLALASGFLHLVVPEASVEFKRLHVFLFNLAVGGGLVLHHVGDRRQPGPLVFAWIALSSAWALCALLEQVLLAVALSVPLLALVEVERLRHFSFLPWDLVAGGSVGRKFQHAGLLCLSLALVFSSAVILGDEILHVVPWEKLTLEVFFLGFSFPVSLTTLGLVFETMPPPRSRWDRALGEGAFWVIDLGVIAFFAFIVFEVLLAEIVIALLLFLAVTIVLVAFARLGTPSEDKAILLSGLAFLVLTGATGVLTVLASPWPALTGGSELVLGFHATVSLYGWNLAGLFVILRRGEGPLGTGPGAVVGLHWLAVFLLVPLGKIFAVVAGPALLAFGTLVAVVLWSGSQGGGKPATARSRAA